MYLQKRDRGLMTANVPSHCLILTQPAGG
jgi:hypothetical protein